MDVHVRVHTGKNFVPSVPGGQPHQLLEANEAQWDREGVYAAFREETLKNDREPGLVQDKSGDRTQVWRELWLMGNIGWLGERGHSAV